MDKILIVGHGASHYAALEEILQSCGMSKALPSYVYGMTPQTLTAKLLQAAAANQNNSQKNISYLQASGQRAFATNVSAEQSPNPYIQKFPKKVWDNLSFDLMVSNAEQSLWGWSDENAINLLEYWANFDEDIAFVLTYDKPDDIIHALLAEFQDNLDENTLIAPLQAWLDYNQALLDFYQKYPERCLLVNGEQVIKSAQDYVQSMAKKITHDLSVPDTQQLTIVQQSSQDISKQSAVSAYFVEQLLSQNQAVLDLFERLQHQADIALVQVKSPAYHPFALLKEVIKQEQHLSNMQQDLLSTQKTLADSELSWQASLDKATKEHEALARLHKQEQQALADTKKQLESHAQENNLIITQLHQVQEELEKYYLDNQSAQEKLKIATEEAKVAKQLAETQKQQAKDLAEAKAKAEQVAKEQQQKLSAQVQKIEQDKQKLQQTWQQEQQKITEENNLIITQLHQVQEELEKYYLDNQSAQEKLKIATEEAKVAKQLAETQKQQAKDLAEAKAKAEKVANEHKKQLEALNQSKQTLEKQLNEQKQQQQASQDVRQENELLITQLHQVQEELEKYYLENQRLKAEQETLRKPVKPIYYGAADRVKQDLPYRLGSAMVNHSKSTKDLAKLPFALAQEYREFQKQQDVQGELPPVEEYQDSHEAEKVKKHLSYRLGKTLVDGMKSPKEILGLPAKLGREIVGFRRNVLFDKKRSIPHVQENRVATLLAKIPSVESVIDRVRPENDQCKKTIILATVDFLPHIGGISIMTHELANNIVDKGIRVLVVAKSGSYIPEGFEAKYDLYVDKGFRKDAKSGEKTVIEDRRVSVMFQRLIKQHNVKSILLMHPYYYAIGARDATKKANINCSIYFHGFEIRSQLLGKYPKNLEANIREKKIYTLRERTIYSAATADNIFVNSSFTKSIFDGFSIKPPITVTGCGISNEALDRFKNISYSDLIKERLHSEVITIGFIGRLVSNKNVDSILKMLSFNKFLNAVIIGVGPEMETLKEKARLLNIENRVNFHGSVSEDNKWSLLKQIDFIALMSIINDNTGHVEGFGIALLEGILAGAIPISSGTGGMVDIIDDGINGLICPIGDEKFQSTRLVELRSNQEEYIKVHGQAIKKLHENFTWDIVSKKIIDVIMGEK